MSASGNSQRSKCDRAAGSASLQWNCLWAQQLVQGGNCTCRRLSCTTTGPTVPIKVKCQHDLWMSKWSAPHQHLISHHSTSMKLKKEKRKKKDLINCIFKFKWFDPVTWMTGHVQLKWNVELHRDASCLRSKLLYQSWIRTAHCRIWKRRTNQ